MCRKPVYSVQLLRHNTGLRLTERHQIIAYRALHILLHGPALRGKNYTRFVLLNSRYLIYRHWQKILRLTLTVA